MQEKPCLMVPIPRELLETYVTKFDSSLHEQYATAQHRIAELEVSFETAQLRIAELERERDQARSEADAVKSTIMRAAQALALNISG